MSSDEEKPFYALLSGECIPDDFYDDYDDDSIYESQSWRLDLDDRKTIDLPFRFKNKDLYDYYNDRNFTPLDHTFNELIQETHEGYYLEGECTECYLHLSEESILCNHETVYCIDDYPDKEENIDVSFMKRGMSIKSSKR